MLLIQGLRASRTLINRQVCIIFSICIIMEIDTEIKFPTFTKVELRFSTGEMKSSVLILLSYSIFCIGDWFVEIINISFAKE